MANSNKILNSAPFRKPVGNDRHTLNRKLYLLCSNVVSPEYKKDSEEVKSVRDGITFNKFNKNYKDCTIAELKSIIRDLENTNNNFRPKYKLATPEQRRTFNWYAISVALVYADFSKLEYINQETGEVLKSDELQKYCVKLFGGNHTLPSNITKVLFDTYINNHSNKYLIEGGFISKCKNPNYLYYERLNTYQMNYLINRYSKIYNELAKNLIINHIHN